MTRREVDVIELKWDGPFTFHEFEKFIEPTDYGVYQVYGTHSVFGPDALLYIGKAAEQHFGARLNQHLGWLLNEPSDLRFYIGRLGGPEQPVDDKSWSSEIDCAEKLLIYSCSPPYNSQNLNSSGPHKNRIVLNFGRRHRLPGVVSTLYRESEFWKLEEGTWKLYEYHRNAPFRR